MKLLCSAVFLLSAVAAHAFDFSPDEADGSSPVPGLLKRRDPEKRNRVFSPIFKVDNVHFQNVTGVPLKEGKNLFLMPRRQRGNRVKPGVGRAEKPEPLQYLKLNYNPAQPDQVCMEYGVVRKANVSDIVVDEDDGDY